MFQGNRRVTRALLLSSVALTSAMSACSDDSDDPSSPTGGSSGVSGSSGSGGVAGKAGSAGNGGSAPTTTAGAPSEGGDGSGRDPGGEAGSGQSQAGAGGAIAGAGGEAGAAGASAGAGGSPEPWSPGSELIVPPGTEIAGKTHAVLAADWWSWIFGAAASTNPLLDETGDDCGVDQPDGVFFLAGNFGGTTVRSCTLPSATPIFFPLINAEADNCNIEPASQSSAEEMQAYLDSTMETPTDFEVELDGELIVDGLEDGLHYAVGQQQFSYDVPVDDSFMHYLAVNFGSPYVEFSGTCTPALSNGYYVGLQGLSAGEHVLRFRGKSSDGFSLNVIYLLTVSP